MWKVLVWLILAICIAMSGAVIAMWKLILEADSISVLLTKSFFGFLLTIFVIVIIVQFLKFTGLFIERKKK